jgi:hypothetical protein
MRREKVVIVLCGGKKQLQGRNDVDPFFFF